MSLSIFIFILTVIMNINITWSIWLFIFILLICISTSIRFSSSSSCSFFNSSLLMISVSSSAVVTWQIRKIIKTRSTYDDEKDFNYLSNEVRVDMNLVGFDTGRCNSLLGRLLGHRPRWVDVLHLIMDYGQQTVLSYQQMTSPSCRAGRACSQWRRGSARPRWAAACTAPSAPEQASVLTQPQGTEI